MEWIKLIRQITSLFFVFFIVIYQSGCQEEAVPTDTSSKSNEAERLKKIDDLEQWKFLDAAQSWYQKLTQPPYSEEIRYTAYTRLINILKERGKDSERALVQENMLRSFPKEAGRLRNDLMYYYLSSWQWEKLRATANDILEKDKPEDKDNVIRMITWVDKWESRKNKIIWEETFSSPPLGLVLAHPTFYKLEPLKREMEATTVTGTFYHAGKPFYWKGDSTILSFDIQIKEMDWTGEVPFGIFSFKNQDRLIANFSCSGGTGDLHYNLDLRVVPENYEAYQNKARATDTYSTLIWYHIELDYLEEVRRAKLSIWKRDDKTFIGEQIVDLLRPFSPGDYMVGISSSPKGPEHAWAFASISIDNIILRGGSWSEPVEKTPLIPIYKINLKAQVNPLEAIQEYTFAIENEPGNWQYFEMRAYLWKAQGNIKNFIDDLKRVIELNPSHPNVVDFLRLVQRP